MNRDLKEVKKWQSTEIGPEVGTWLSRVRHSKKTRVAGGQCRQERVVGEEVRGW